MVIFHCFSISKKLVLQAISYQSPFQCILEGTAKLPPMPANVKTLLKQFRDRLQKEIMALFQFMKSLQADTNSIRAAGGKGPISMDGFNIKVRLFTATQKTWDDL